jgi:hypothetical protein
MMMIYFTFFINIQPHWWMKFGSLDHLVDFFSQEKKKPNETERAGLYRYPVQTDRFFRSI